MTSAANRFDSLANAILAAGGQTSPSELHGFASGILAAGAKPDKKRWQRELAELLELDAVPADLNREFLQLAQDCQQQLGDSNFDFQLLLTDEQDITARALTLGHWCQGFLHGFGIGAFKGKLLPTSEEALQDIGAIAQVDADEVEATEEAESQLLELQEYVRMAALNIFTEVRGDKSGKGPTVH
ncbi:hypothetical protein SAMN04487965_2783 [Microbulbifer donghaiensis]|uniref:YecA family protein n=1 Tax=Microbulbifer donghaiensis TaxID=494016 RepID=A0A1M5F3B4_9GAMM|nr:UPF0149 family protein [Microbulbifer donghaiensis]SHF86004.1 hypothetical protein SAMN04487965_2783 [Microbulbifer donghaiensis]